MAVPRTFRRHLLPQRDDLFRRSHQGDADRTLHQTDQARRLALYRSLGIPHRGASRIATRRSHDLPENGMIASTAAWQPARGGNGADEGLSVAGRRFYDA